MSRSLLRVGFNEVTFRRHEVLGVLDPRWTRHRVG